MLAMVAIAHDLWIAVQLTPQKRIAIYAYSFIQNHRTFNYYYNFLLPQIGSVIFLYGCYLWISLVIVPKMNIGRMPKTGAEVLKRVISIIAQILSICILLGPCVNFASYYINPYTFYYRPPFVAGNYGLSFFPFTFGYHPQPFANVFGGLDISIGFVAIYMVCISIREIIIYYVEQSAYRVIIANQVTMALMLYLIIPVFQSFWTVFTYPVIYRFY